MTAWGDTRSAVRAAARLAVSLGLPPHAVKVVRTFGRSDLRLVVPPLSFAPLRFGGFPVVRGVMP